MKMIYSVNIAGCSLTLLWWLVWRVP